MKYTNKHLKDIKRIRISFPSKAPVGTEKGPYSDKRTNGQTH